MIQSVVRLIAWEWFKLRKRWLPWILLVVLIAFSQLFVWGNFFAYSSLKESGGEVFFGATGPRGPITIDCKRLEANDLPPELADDTPLAVIQGLKEQCAQQALRQESELASLVASFSLPNSIAQVFTIVHTFALILVGILSASMMGTDYSWGTLRSVLARGTNRASYIAAKLVLLALLIGAALLVIAIATAISSLIASALAAPSDTPSGDWANVASMFGRTWIAILPYAVLGTTAAVVTGSAAAAIGIGLAYFFVEQILSAIFLALFDWFSTVGDYLLGRSISAWMAAGAQSDTEFLGRVGEFPGQLHAFLVLAAYVVALSGLSFWIFLRRDIKGAGGG